MVVVDESSQHPGSSGEKRGNEVISAIANALRQPVGRISRAYPNITTTTNNNIQQKEKEPPFCVHFTFFIFPQFFFL